MKPITLKLRYNDRKISQHLDFHSHLRIAVGRPLFGPEKVSESTNTSKTGGIPILIKTHPALQENGTQDIDIIN